MTNTFRGLLVVLTLTPACKLGRVVVPDGATKAWSAMDATERGAHMVAHVEPRLRKLFQEFDAERFSDFGCQTCHGSDAQKRSFAMPNPGLPRVSAAGFYKDARKAHPETVKFMWKQVEKNVAQAIGVTYGPAGQIACSACHLEGD